MQVLYINLQMDPLESTMTTHPFQMGLEISIEQYPDSHFTCRDNTNPQFGDCLVHTWILTSTSCSEPLLTISIFNSSSSSPLSSLSSGSSKSQFQWWQCSLSKMLPGAPSWSLSAGWRSILFIQQTFYSWVHPPGRSLEEMFTGSSQFISGLP